MRIGLIIALMVLGIATAVPVRHVQASESQEASAAENEGARKKPRVICTREATAGSHLRRRVCRTERELEIERLEVERMRDSDNTLRELPTDN